MSSRVKDKIKDKAKKMKKAEIRLVYESYEDEDISTERLLQIVADECNCEVYEVVEAICDE